MPRELLTSASRIVVKLGTGVLTDEQRKPDREQMAQLVAQIGALRQSGREVILVSSGAVGAGMGVLGFDSRPVRLPELQACAAVGQLRLMAAYDQLFSEFNLRVGQVLLTHDDLRHHERHLNARNTLVTLLSRGVVPIINENDAVSFTEIQFGDNDRLAALVACLLPADLMVILTTVDGVIRNFGRSDAWTLSTIEQVDDELESIAGGAGSPASVGGMASKIQAAKIVVRAGIPMVIASGRKQGALQRILDGHDEGTVFVPNPNRLKGRKRWIAFFHHPAGSLVVDDGARKALVEQGRSLLAPGVTRCEGQFNKGDIVCIRDLNGTEFARGLTRFPLETVRSGQIAREVVVHRDDLVVW